MLKRAQLVRFFITFILLYGFLIFPSARWNRLYRGYLRKIGALCFKEDSPRRIVRIEPRDGTPLDTNIILADPATRDHAGNMQARILALDSRGIGWIPTALTFALILSTPIPLKRRLSRGLLGIFLVQAFIVFTLWVYISNESLDFFGARSGPHPLFLSKLGDLLETTLVTQLGASIVAPVLIWLIVSFRMSDWETMVAPLKWNSPASLGGTPDTP